MQHHASARDLNVLYQKLFRQLRAGLSPHSLPCVLSLSSGTVFVQVLIVLVNTVFSGVLNTALKRQEFFCFVD